MEGPPCRISLEKMIMQRRRGVTNLLIGAQRSELSSPTGIRSVHMLLNYVKIATTRTLQFCTRNKVSWTRPIFLAFTGAVRCPGCKRVCLNGALKCDCGEDPGSAFYMCENRLEKQQEPLTEFWSMAAVSNGDETSRTSKIKGNCCSQV